MSRVRYVGINSLDSVEKEILKKLVLGYMETIDRSLPDANITFHVKLHEVGGRVKYSFHARTIAGNYVFSTKADDWDLRRTVHKVMKKLLTSIEHGLHVEGQKQQKFHPRKGKRGFGKGVKMRLKGLIKW